MDAPEGPQDGVVFTQNIAAISVGRVNAVQRGDQYNYIYRGAPPYRVEPFPLAEPAVPVGLARVPSRLLTARHRVVPFFPRPELALLESWRDNESPGLSVRLVHAEGGSGKTRLAAEFAERSAGAGWAVALARHRSEVASAGGGDGSLTVRSPGLVMIVDYAERWPLEDLVTLVRQHRDAARDRLRILLLSRPTGTWWQGLAHQFAKLDILDVDAVRLEALPDDPGVRAGMYTMARDRFAEVFSLADSAGLGTPDQLDDPVFGLTLTVHMRALVDVDAASRGQAPPTGSGQASLSSYLLDREHDHWRSYHDQGHGPMPTGERTMGRAVYVATLTRSLTPADAATALARTALANNQAAAGQLIADHARCYPPADPSLVLDPLYPDRLGEDYVALSLPGHEDEFGYHATDRWTTTAPALLLAPGGLNGAPAAYTRQALSTLVEAAHRWPHLTTQHLDPLLRRHPTLALTAGSATLIRLCDLPTLDLAVLEAIEPHLPRHAHVDLDLGAAALTARLTHQRLATTTNPATRATLFAELGRRYSNAGLHQRALASTRQAATLCRTLAKAEPAAHLPNLATALTDLGVRHSLVGEHEEALTPTTEAVHIYRRLAEANPAAHQPNLAVALGNLGLRLRQVGRRQEALDRTQETAELYRALAETDSAAHQPGLARCLLNLVADLAAVGRQQDALAPAREAVEAYRWLAEANPAAFQPDLAAALNNLGTALSETGHRREALAPTAEAVELYRRMAEANPAAYQPDLAAALNNLGSRLATVGRREEALARAHESVEVRRRLAEANPAAYQPDLAMSLNSLGNRLAAVGRHQEALDTTREAVDICRPLAEANPAAHQLNLAMSLGNLGTRFSAVGRREKALSPAREAVEICRRLAEANPAAYQPHLAKARDILISLQIDEYGIPRRATPRPTADQLLCHLDYLIYEEPARLVPLLGQARTQDGRLAAAVYRTSLIHHRDVRPDTRRWILALSAARLGFPEYARRLRPAAAPYGVWPRWSTSFPDTANRNSRTGYRDGVAAVACTVLDGRPVAVTGGFHRDEHVRVWDLARGEQIGQFLTGQGEVRAVACTVLDGRPVAVTGDGSLGVWDLARGEQIGQPLTGHLSGVEAVACTVLDGRPVAVTGSSYDTAVRVWDLTRGKQIGQPLTGHLSGVEAVVCTVLDGRPVAVTGSSYDTAVRVWDLTRGELVRPLPMLDTVHCLASGPGGELVVGVGPDALVLDIRKG
ncbi:hypothetical protein BSZ07_38095 [Streptomyces sp. M1013]|uniref:tetratricopeptide repeat protein n=1 Tax=Streptomyces sp. M1013 TaxID=549798 RepID=UPI000978E520|nr:tetratricopeptide repeat protein [Streptomyces sp. M1013]OMI84592.1 hypothetical protein BSZ07_38095 [Streptomyces sp. M1013]